MDGETLEETILELEKRFWVGDSEFSAENLTDGAKMVFPKPIGEITDRESIESVVDSQRWSDVRIEDSSVTELTDSVAVLTYRSTAVRDEDEARYVTLASSVYVADDGSWELALHQQTPDPPGIDDDQ